MALIKRILPCTSISRKIKDKVTEFVDVRSSIYTIILFKKKMNRINPSGPVESTGWKNMAESDLHY